MKHVSIFFRYVLRVVTFPLFAGIIIISLVRMFVQYSCNWILYGGEFILSEQKKEDSVVLSIK